MFEIFGIEFIEKFVEITENNKDLENCFDENNENLEKSSKRWLKTLKNIIKMSFTKIRVKKNKTSPELEALFKKKEILKTKIAGIDNIENINEKAKLYEDLETVNTKIEQFCSEKNY